MKKYFLHFFLSILILVHIYPVHGQNLGKAWDQIYKGNVYESFTCIMQTADHGLIVAGSSSSGIGGDKTQDNHDTSYSTFDFWIVKTDSNGTLLWEKSYGSSMHEEFIDIKETADHGFILGGTTMATMTPNGDVSDSSRGSKDYWIVKTDSVGHKLWDKRFGGDLTDLLTSVIQTSDGGYLLGGTSLSGLSGDKSANNHNSLVLNYDYWIVKTDSNGNKLWDKTIGGNLHDELHVVMQIPSGGYLLGGNSASYISGDKSEDSRGGADYWLVKIDNNGNILWDKTYGGDNVDWLFSMTLTHDGGYALAGTSGSSDSIGEKTVPSRGRWDYWVVKTDANGNKLWDHAYGGSEDEELGYIMQTQDNGFLISGESYSNTSGEKSEDNLGVEQCWIIKTDSNGLLEWDKTVFTYNHDEEGYAIQTHEGCYVAGVYTEADTGGYKTHHNLVASDYWIVKFCYETPIVSFISSDTVFCAKKCIDFFDLSTNNPTVWYWSFPGAVPASSTDQNPTNICYNAYGIFDVTLVAVNPFGSGTLTVTDFIHEYLFASPVITVSGDTLFCSPAYSYQWYLNSNPIAGDTNYYCVMNIPGSYSVIISDSLGCQETSGLYTTGLPDQNSKNRIAVFPNPSDGKFDVYATFEKKETVQLTVLNLEGKTVYSKQFSTEQKRSIISIKLIQPPGFYILQIKAGDEQFQSKLLIR